MPAEYYYVCIEIIDSNRALVANNIFVNREIKPVAAPSEPVSNKSFIYGYNLHILDMLTVLQELLDAGFRVMVKKHQNIKE